MDDILQIQYTSLSARHILAMRRNLAAVHKDAPELHLATACSGSDVLFYVFEKMLCDWGQRFGLRFQLAHDFACESVEFKQAFIQHHFAPQRLYPDLHVLHDSTVTDIAGNLTQLTTPTMFACGIECDSISGLNQQRVLNQDCVADDEASTRTGNTARSFVKVTAKYRPALVLAENVKNLANAGRQGTSNLTALIKLLNAEGYYVVHTALDPKDFGIPCSRGRYYLVGVLTSSKSIDQLKDGAEVPDWVDRFHEVLADMRVPPLPIERFLQDDGNDEVIAANAGTQDAGAKPKAKAKSRQKARATGQAKSSRPDPAVDEGGERKLEQYTIDHLNAYKMENVEWPPTYSEDFHAKTQRLCDRQKEILFLEEATAGEAASVRPWTCRDINMTLAWSRVRQEILPCIVSSSVMWIRGVINETPDGQVKRVIDRCLSGAELLSLQGFPLCLQARADAQSGDTAEKKFSDRQKVDVAGNAFNAAVLIPVLTATFATCPVAKAIALMGPSDGPCGSPSQEEDADSEGGECEGGEGGESEEVVSESCAPDSLSQSTLSDWEWGSF